MEECEKEYKLKIQREEAMSRLREREEYLG